MTERRDTGPTSEMLRQRALAHAQQESQASLAASNGALPPGAAGLPEGARLQQCDGPDCQAYFFMALYRKKDGSLGKPHPVDWPSGGPKADLVVEPAAVNGQPVVHKRGTAGGATERAWRLFSSHFATCPNSELFRR